MHVKSVQTTAWTGSAQTARFWDAVEEQQLQRLADEIRGLRKEKGWTAEGLAHRSGVSWRTISRLENREVNDPRESTLQALAAALDVTVETLVGPRLRLDAPEGPLEEIRRMLREVLERLPGDAPPAPGGETGRRIAKPRPTPGGKKRKPPKTATGGSQDNGR